MALLPLKSILACLLLLMAVHCTLQSALEWTEILHHQLQDWTLPEGRHKVSMYVTAYAYGGIAGIAAGFVLMQRAFILQALLGLVLMARAAWGVYGMGEPSSKDWGEDTLVAWIYHMGVAFLALGMAFSFPRIAQRRR